MEELENRDPTEVNTCDSDKEGWDNMRISEMMRA
jgi:hypothetical protein